MHLIQMISLNTNHIIVVGSLLLGMYQYGSLFMIGNKLIQYVSLIS